MEAGETIAGKYRVNRLLGTGGMASVWAATNIFTEREFAIKIMLPQVASTPEAAISQAASMIARTCIS